MNDPLRVALGADRRAIERGLTLNTNRQHALRRRLKELELEAQQARAILDRSGTWIPWPPLPTPRRPPTLHEAMLVVLEWHRNDWMSTTLITREIIRRGLYRRRDGLAPSTRDVCARAATYHDMFARDGHYLRLRHGSLGERPQPQYLDALDPAVLD